jgi:hypothetical protein
MSAYSPPLSHQPYGTFSTPGVPYPPAPTSAGLTPAEPPPAFAPPPGPSQAAPRGEQNGGGPHAAAEGKARLRKACDSCSIRKVKVRNAIPGRERQGVADGGPFFFFLGRVLYSVTKKDLLAGRAPPWIFHAPMTDRVAAGALPIDTRKRSRGAGSSRPSRDSRYRPRPRMRLRPLRPSPNSRSSRPSRYALSPSCSCSSTTTSPTSTPWCRSRMSHPFGKLCRGARM